MSVCLKERGGGREFLPVCVTGRTAGFKLLQVLTRLMSQLETSKIVKRDGYLDI